jgi:hypothetical protein
MLERRSRKTRRATKQSDVRVGIALAISAFAISIFLYLQPQYFGALTKAVAIALTCLGFAGLGIELNKITSEELDSLINREKGPGIFNNLGFGIASLIVWGALYHYFRITWVNVVTSVVLLIGVYSTTLGLVQLGLNPSAVICSEGIVRSPSGAPVFAFFFRFIADFRRAGTGSGDPWRA